RAPYRYGMDDVTEAGWMTTKSRRQFTAGRGFLPRMSLDGREQMAALAAWAKEHRVRVVAALPLELVAKESTTEYRRHSAAYLMDLAEYFSIVRQASLGANSNAADFADTPVHLVATAALSYTESLARAVQAGEYWDQATLRSVADGTASP